MPEINKITGGNFMLWINIAAVLLLENFNWSTHRTLGPIIIKIKTSKSQSKRDYDLWTGKPNQDWINHNYMALEKEEVDQEFVS